MWLKIKPAAGYAGVGEKTLRSWIESGGIPVARPPVGPALVATEDIDRYLRGHQTRAVDIDAIVESALSSP